MKKSNGFVVCALALVCIQFFILFLPTIRLDETGWYDEISESRSLSAIQMMTDFSDTIHDPDLDPPEDTEDRLLLDSCESHSLIMGFAMLFAVFCAVTTFCHKSVGWQMGSLSLASVSLAIVPIMESSFLADLCRIQEDKSYSLLGIGLLQMFLVVIIPILMVVARDEEKQEEEKELAERLKNSTSNPLCQNPQRSGGETIL